LSNDMSLLSKYFCSYVRRPTAAFRINASRQNRMGPVDK
jgi:hypothetical protein